MDNSAGKIHDLIVELFKSVGQSLLGEYGLTYASGAPKDPVGMSEQCFISVLSASAEGIRVLCYIRFPWAVGSFLYKVDSPSMEDLRDLCGELNNQMVGKVKNQLLGYQCRLMLGLPTTLSGKDLAAFSLPQAEVVTHQFSCVAGELDLVVHSIIQNHVVIADQPDVMLVGGAEEGALDFF
jgi:hypothetical protein